MRQNINLQQLSQQESIEQLLCALFGPVSSSVSTTFVGSNNAHQNQGRTKTSQCQPPFCMQSAGWSPSSPSTIAATTNVWNKEWLSRMLLQQEQLNGTDSDYYLGNTDTTTIRTTALISHLIELERQQQKHEANEAKQRIAHLQQQLQQQMAIDTQITSRQLLLGTLEQAFACGGFGSK
jgi:hypothetical protein